MVDKYFKSNVTSPKLAPREIEGSNVFDELSKELVGLIKETPEVVDQHMINLAFSDALAAIWKLINKANTYIEKEAPWKLSKAGENDKLAAVMYNLCEVLKVTAFLVSPFIPSTADKMWKQLGLSGKPSLEAKLDGVKVAKGDPLFPRIQK
jgi:methionyl-tRNA synthetase